MRLIKHEPWNYPGHLQFCIRYDDRKGHYFYGETFPYPRWSTDLKTRGGAQRNRIAGIIRRLRRLIRQEAARH